MVNRDAEVKPFNTLADGLISRIGHTPLFTLHRIGAEIPGVQLLAKAEWFNPGGSVKDRAAANIILEAERAEKLGNGQTLLDATSGNTGVAFAMIGAARGIPVHLCVPENASGEVIQTMRAFGATVTLTSPLESSDGAIRAAQELAQKEPDRYFYADQYNNPANWQAHVQTTGPEIWEQTEGQITHFIAGLGTSGTFMGTGRFLRERNPAIRLISLEPDSPLHGLEGLKQMATSIVPGIYDERLADEQVTVRTEAAYGMVKRLAKEEGLLVGISAGAAAAGALELARKLKHGKIVMVFPDGGSRYLHEPFWKQ
ncbi:MAG: cysteine synthase [Candidatus Omnitrophica bacterium CG11_big_fil_rev_8_21_14_0_20_64_10]|nr:MAG: cysteine synthase [Candidatus Omnitrophica bacterium CG11_big_fil_rev_8_21_14_0_20_64_10]